MPIDIFSLHLKARLFILCTNPFSRLLDLYLENLYFG